MFDAAGLILRMSRGAIPATSGCKLQVADGHAIEDVIITAEEAFQFKQTAFDPRAQRLQRSAESAAVLAVPMMCRTGRTECQDDACRVAGLIAARPADAHPRRSPCCNQVRTSTTMIESRVPFMDEGPTAIRSGRP